MYPSMQCNRVMKVISVSLEACLELTILAWWRCAFAMCGRLSVTSSLMTELLSLSAQNWDFHIRVRIE